MKNISITREEFLNYISTKSDTEDKTSKNTQHYLDYFDKFQKTGKKSSWNWAGILPIGFAYRGMYLNSIIFYQISDILGRAVDYLEASEKLKLFNLEVGDSSDIKQLFIYLICAIVLHAIFARYMDYMYLIFVDKKIKKGSKPRKPSILHIIAVLAIIIVPLALLIGCLYLYDNFLQ